MLPQTISKHLGISLRNIPLNNKHLVPIFLDSRYERWEVEVRDDLRTIRVFWVKIVPNPVNFSNSNPVVMVVTNECAVVSKIKYIFTSSPCFYFSRFSHFQDRPSSSYWVLCWSPGCWNFHLIQHFDIRSKWVSFSSSNTNKFFPD